MLMGCIVFFEKLTNMPVHLFCGIVDIDSHDKVGRMDILATNVVVHVASNALQRY